MWIIRDRQLTNSDFIPLPTSYITQPYPEGTWLMNSDGELKAKGMIDNVYGACSQVPTLTKVKFPKTLRKIGDYAFYNTALTSVKIPQGCEYGKHSFPTGCEVKFYV